MYQIETGVTSDVGVPSTYLVFLELNCLQFLNDFQSIKFLLLVQLHLFSEIIAPLMRKPYNGQVVLPHADSKLEI